MPLTPQRSCLPESSVSPNDPDSPLRFPDSDDDLNDNNNVIGETIQDDINDLARNPKFTKFIDNSPEGLKKAKAMASAKRKAKDKKIAKKSGETDGKRTGNGKGPQKRSCQAAENDEDNEDNDKDEGTTKGRPPKKAKDTDDETRPRFTVYVHITAPEPAIPARLQRGAAKPVPNKLVQRGPFFWTLDDSSSFVTFKDALAKAIPCKLALLPVTKMEWRYEKPANDSKKLLVSEAGFEAMVVSLAERKKDFVILIIMPPPGKDEATWDTDDGDHVENQFDYYQEIAPEGSDRDMSAKGQIASMTRDSASHLDSLRDRYPIGVYPLFPNLRIYSRMLGAKMIYWELNTLRLQIWANALSVGKTGVTLEVPPNSAHFDINKQTKVPEVPTPVQPAPIPAIPTPPAPPQFPQPPAYAQPPPYAQQPVYVQHAQPPYAPYMPPHFLPAHWGNPYSYGPAHPPTPFFPPPPNIPMYPPAIAPSPAPSPGVAAKMKITLERFCEHYGISASDRRKLELLEYTPGNRAVEHLAKEDWKEVKFSTLGWQAFLTVHQRFLKDVKHSIWNALAPVSEVS